MTNSLERRVGSGSKYDDLSWGCSHVNSPMTNSWKLSGFLWQACYPHAVKRLTKSCKIRPLEIFMVISDATCVSYCYISGWAILQIPFFWRGLEHKFSFTMHEPVNVMSHFNLGVLCFCKSLSMHVHTCRHANDRKLVPPPHQLQMLQPSGLSLGLSIEKTL